MSFYIKTIQNYKTPKKFFYYAECISFDILEDLKDGIDKYDGFELYVNNELNPDYLDELSNIVLENDISIGLVCENEDVINNNIDIIRKFNIHILNQNHVRIFNENRLVKKKIFSCYDVALAPKIVEDETCYYKKLRKSIKSDLDESFKQKLIRYMNKSKKTNVEIYTKGQITRQVFSKIISNEDYCPKKPTILCLIIGMELCLDDALDLLNSAGFTLSNSIRLDKIVKHFIENENFDLDEINFKLDEYGEIPLGWQPREE